MQKTWFMTGAGRSLSVEIAKAALWAGEHERCQAEAEPQEAVNMEEYQTAAPGCNRKCRYRILCQQAEALEPGMSAFRAIERSVTLASRRSDHSGSEW